jgi:hypothetical protein
VSEWITHRLPTAKDADDDGNVFIPCQRRTRWDVPGEDFRYMPYGKVARGVRWWPNNEEAIKAAAAEQEATDPTPEPTPEPAAEPSPAVAGVPSDEELWEVQLKARQQTRPDVPWHEWGFLHDSAHFAAHRALYDYGYRRCLEEAKATWELNSGLASDLTALQEENAQLKSEEERLKDEIKVLDRCYNDAANELVYKIKELERELERRGGEVKLEPDSEPTPAPEPAVRKAVQIAGHNNALSALCDDGTVWLWTSYDGWTPYKTIPQTPIK